MMNPVPWLQMTNMISYQGLVRTFPKDKRDATFKPDYLDGLVMHVEKGKVYLDGEFVNH